MVDNNSLPHPEIVQPIPHTFDPITGHFNPPYEGWCPYCLNCKTMNRMTPTDYGWKCDSCENPIGRDLMHWNGSECPTTLAPTVDDTA